MNYNQNPSQETTSQGDASIIQIVWVDFIAFIGVIGPLILWIVFTFMSLTETRSTPNRTLLLIALIATLVGLSVAAWRIRSITALFEDGQEVSATISNLSFYRDRGRVSYTYIFQGQKYLSGSAVMKTKRTKAIQIGQQETVLVDRNNPKRAIIRRLYQ